MPDIPRDQFISEQREAGRLRRRLNEVREREEQSKIEEENNPTLPGIGEESGLIRTPQGMFLDEETRKRGLFYIDLIRNQMAERGRRDGRGE